MVHGEHQPAGKGVAVDQRHGGHRIRQEAAEQGVQNALQEADGAGGTLELEPVAVELLDAARADDDARRLPALDDVEREKQGVADGRGETVVRG